jgi:hypothetical protein
MSQLDTRCHECDGVGGFETTDWQCCGQFLPTGECCAAKYGIDRLVPVPVMEPCEWCGGTGIEPDPETEAVDEQA